MVTQVSAYEFWGSIAVLLTLACCALWDVYSQRRLLARSREAEREAGAAAPHAAATPGAAGDARKGLVWSEEALLQEFQGDAERIVGMGVLQAALLGLCLPFVTLRVLACRLGVFRPRTAYAGSLVIAPAMLALLVLILIPAAQGAVPMAIGGTMVVLLAAGVAFCFKASADWEWRAIDDFLGHRHVHRTTKNALAVLTLVMTAGQLSAIAVSTFWHPTPQEHPSSASASYEEFKAYTRRVLSAFLFDVSFMEDVVTRNGPRLVKCIRWCSPCLSICAVLMWWLLYSGIFYKIMSLAYPVTYLNQFTDNKQRTEAKKKQEGIRRCLYSSVARRKLYTTVFLLISDTFSVSIVSGLIKLVDCTTEQESTIHLTIDPDIACFVGYHRWLTIFAVLLSVFFSTTAILTAPFVVADSNGVFTSDELDIRYEPLYYVQERLCKFGMAAVAILFRSYPGVCRNVNLVAAYWMCWKTMRSQPCSVIWVNVVREGVYQGATVVYAAVILDAISGLAWWPLLWMMLGVLAVLGRLAGRAMKLRSLPHPTFRDSEIVGGWWPHGIGFSDATILRGFHHRLVTLSFWLSNGVHGRQICGFQGTYQVDGVVITGPGHFCVPALDEDSTNVLDGPPTHVLSLDEDEFVVGVHRPKHVLCLGMALRTSKGKTFTIGEGDAPTDLSEWSLQVPAGQAVAVHGATNGNFQNIGFILQDDMEHRYTELISSDE